jgi:hypothetical protein
MSSGDPVFFLCSVSNSECRGRQRGAGGVSDQALQVLSAPHYLCLVVFGQGKKQRDSMSTHAVSDLTLCATEGYN